nr:class I SAM-dependent methyltransferase [uncultured Solibaculum sp.]
MKEHPFLLDSRLSQCADFVRPGSRMVDVGTDHAYLPVWLTRRGICPHAIGVDIRPQPLARAKETVEKYRAEDLVELRLSDGLHKVLAHEAEDIVMAGMGGEVIAGILEEASWIQDPEKRLILQPMSRAECLREYLFQHGFALEQEEIVMNNRRLYTVMQACFTGHIIPATPLMLWAGRLTESKSPYAPAFLRRQARHLRNCAQGQGEGYLTAALQLEAAADVLSRRLVESR